MMIVESTALRSSGIANINNGKCKKTVESFQLAI